MRLLHGHVRWTCPYEEDERKLKKSDPAKVALLHQNINLG